MGPFGPLVQNNGLNEMEWTEYQSNGLNEMEWTEYHQKWIPLPLKPLITYVTLYVL